MADKDLELFRRLKEKGLDPGLERVIKRELAESRGIKPGERHALCRGASTSPLSTPGFYDSGDMSAISNLSPLGMTYHNALKSLDDLLEHDRQREADGFPRKIRIGRLIKPSPGKKERVIVVPTTTEDKFYHNNSITEEEPSTGGSGEGDEGDVIGEQSIDPQQGEGEGGAGEGGDAEHDVSSEAFDLGKIITEKFELPNLKDKGKKKSFTKYKYDLTDKNRGFGQVLDKKSTLKKIIETNIILGRVTDKAEFESHDFLINPGDHIYRIMSKEKDFENQAVVFFLRDYSGSMGGKPTEVITSQHLFIYSWLMYQYQNNVETRFIMHDTEAKEVKDFHTYHNLNVAGGTNVHPAFELTNKIVEEEKLAIENNIYVFHGTDGDDWENTGEKMLEATKKMLSYANRIGITIARNTWSNTAELSTVEKYMNGSGLLREKPDFIRMDAMVAESASEERIIEGIKKLIS